MFCDSCILVKLLTNEPDSATFSSTLQGKPLAISELALTEVFSALLAKERDGTLKLKDRERAWRQLSNWIEEEQVAVYPLSSAIQSKARMMLASCHPQVPLRTLDALHLATCDHHQDLPMVTTDARMLAAARVLGLPVM